MSMLLCGKLYYLGVRIDFIIIIIYFIYLFIFFIYTFESVACYTDIYIVVHLLLQRYVCVKDWYFTHTHTHSLLYISTKIDADGDGDRTTSVGLNV